MQLSGTVDIDISTLSDICHTGATEDATLKVTASQYDIRLSVKIALVTATIYVAHDMSIVNGNLTVGEHLTMITSTKDTSTDGDGLGIGQCRAHQHEREQQRLDTAAQQFFI